MSLSIAAGAQQVLNKYGSIIEKYRGEIPAAIVAARIWHETQGNPCPAPTACCDEQGLMQLWPATRLKYGVTDACDPDQNIRAGCAHWNSETTRLRSVDGAERFQGDDFWMLAYLYTAIGSGATTRLLKISPVSTYDDLVSWVQQALADGTLEANKAAWGTQSADAIARRVKNAQTYVAAATNGSVNSTLVAGTGGGGLLMLAVGLGLAWLYWRRG